MKAYEELRQIVKLDRDTVVGLCDACATRGMAQEIR